MRGEGWFVAALLLVIFITGVCVGIVFCAPIQKADAKNRYDTRAVTNGCAIRVLDSASGEVKTVWKDGEP